MIARENGNEEAILARLAARQGEQRVAPPSPLQQAAAAAPEPTPAPAPAPAPSPAPAPAQGGGLDQYALAHLDPSKLPSGLFTQYSDPEAATPSPDLKYALMSGAQLGLDNNYKYAVYPDGHVEYAYQGNDPYYSDGMSQDANGNVIWDQMDPMTHQLTAGSPGLRNGQTKTASELAGMGWNYGSAGKDAHGVPLPGSLDGLSYAPWNDPKPSNNFFWDSLAPSLMLGAATAGVGGLGAAGAGLTGVSAGATAGATAGAMNAGANDKNPLTGAVVGGLGGAASSYLSGASPAAPVETSGAMDAPTYQESSQVASLDPRYQATQVDVQPTSTVGPTDASLAPQYQQTQIDAPSGGLDLANQGNVFPGESANAGEYPVINDNFVGDLPIDAPPPSAYEQATAPTTDAGNSNWWDKAKGYAGGLEQFMKDYPTVGKLGLGVIAGGLAAYGSSSRAKQNADATAQANARRDARQAMMDNPAPFAPMSGPGFGAPTRTDGAGPGDMRTYGQRPEYRFFKAHGGTPTSGRIGAFDQLKMVHGDGGGQDDNVPAMLSPKEYVIDADVVAALGDGNPDHGAKKLDAFRQRVRSHKRVSSSKIPPKARPVESYMGAT